MGKTYDHIPDNLIQWIRIQEVFWVATAPLAGNGHVNVSPKGVRGTFHVEGPNKVWYDDLSGSGCETIAHLKENGRITFLLNAFEGPPRIARLYGRGVVHEFGTPEYEALIPLSHRNPSSRAVIVVDVDRVGTSCGWSVPFYSFQGHRRFLLDFFHEVEKREVAFDCEPHEEGAVYARGIRAFWSRFNLSSIDKLPAMLSGHISKAPVTSVVPDAVTAGFRDTKQKPQSEKAPVRVEARYHFSLAEGDIRLLLGFVVGLTISSLFWYLTILRSGAQRHFSSMY